MPIQTPDGLKLTYEDYAAIPDDGQRHEILDGVHYVSPAPRSQHQVILGQLFGQMWILAEQTGEFRVYLSPLDIELSRTDICQPDLLVIASDRVRIVGEMKVVGAPDLAIEILSPSTAARDRGLKREIYARCGVAEYWIVDGKNNTLAQHTGDDLALANTETASVTSIRFPSLTVDLTRVW